MSGRAAIVTGAAAGLGRATALRLAQAGASVCLVDIDAGGLAATERELQALGVPCPRLLPPSGCYGMARVLASSR
mgnify:CR=1 FL=1